MSDKSPKLVESKEATDVLEKPRHDAQYKEPNKYRVVLINDDFTPMEFVIWVLQVLFAKNENEATTIMLQVHHEGRGVCGAYPLGIARSKADRVCGLAERQGYPLQCIVEDAQSKPEEYDA